MWPLSLTWKKLDTGEAEPAPKMCRVCWGGDEGGEEKWVAPCRCPRAVAWVHRRCLAWRLKWTPIGEDKLRCAICKFPYKKRLRLKSLREWHDGWIEDGDMLFMDWYFAYIVLFFHKQLRDAHLAKTFVILLGVLWTLFRIYAANRQPERYGLALYKRFLAVAVRDWILDAPSPQRGSSSTTS